MKVKPIFAWYDIWVGFFWDKKKHILYFFPVPCFGIMISFNRDKNLSETKLSKWKIDYSAGRPILTYENCSVIQDEQAEYIMNLLKKGVGL